MAAAAILLVVFTCGLMPRRDSAAEGPEVRVVQVTPVSQSAGLHGPANVEYELRVRNPWAGAVALTSVEIRTDGIAAYVMIKQYIPLRATVPPRASSSPRFVAAAWFRGEPQTLAHPVKIHGVARFETADGVWYAPIDELIP